MYKLNSDIKIVRKDETDNVSKSEAKKFDTGHRKKGNPR